MFDIPLEQLIALVKTEPGAGAVQTVLLTLIWLNSRKINKKMDELTANDVKHEVRITKLEANDGHQDSRLSILEGKGD